MNIHTSTTSVYTQTGERTEKHFDPTACPIKMGSKADYLFPGGYGEGKRMCEAVLFQGAAYNVAAMRIPVVLGPDDYIERLLNLVKRVRNRQQIIVPNPLARVSFVHVSDAAKALQWLANETICEPVNIASAQTIGIGELIELVETTVGTKAELVKTGPDEWHNQFVEEEPLTVNVERAAALGFVAQPITNWLPGLIQDLSNRQ